MTSKAKLNYGMGIYEDWMDHRGVLNSQRSNSIVSRGELARSNARKRFQLHNAYAESIACDDVNRESSRNGRRAASVPPESRKLEKNTPNAGSQKSGGPNDPSMNVKEKKELIKSIVNDFGPFYDWITNGRDDDINENIIKSLLFKQK